jgi:DNA-binding transcriptional regulator YiaG
MKKYKSEISMVLHQEAVAMHRVGGISDERMREYDELCLVKPPAIPVPHVPAQRPSGAARSGAPVFAGSK